MSYPADIYGLESHGLPEGRSRFRRSRIAGQDVCMSQSLVDEPPRQPACDASAAPLDRDVETTDSKGAINMGALGKATYAHNNVR
jgi:hypothetical protein